MTCLKDGDSPRIWLLLDDRPGHQTQARGLAQALQAQMPLQIEEKLLSFNTLNQLPNSILGASLVSINKTKSSALNLPYPDLVIAMGRRVAPVARWIKRQSGGYTLVVLLGRKAASDPFLVDMSISCTHFGLFPHARLKQLVVPPTQVNWQVMEQLKCDSDDPMRDIAHPHVVWLLGGPTAQHTMDMEFATRMAGEITKASEKLGAGLAIVTSRRTPRSFVNILQSIAPHAHIHQWRRDNKDNPYLSYLAHADFLVVTGESESMLAEAVATRRPLTIYPLVPKPATLKLKFAGWLKQQAQGSGFLSTVCTRILTGGWITPPRNLATMHKLIEINDLGCLFEEEINRTPPAQNNETADLAHQISLMLERQSPTAKGLTTL
jgi:uncharacterized protein